MTLLRLDRVALRVFPKIIEAPDFNRIRLILGHSTKPLRLSLPHHRGLEVILDHDAWLVVDSLKGDEPVLAWTAFKRPHTALHEPVNCEVRLYHTHAGLIMGSALEALIGAMRDRDSGLHVSTE